VAAGGLRLAGIVAFAVMMGFLAITALRRRLVD
jgi:hypothetical protein